MMNSPLSYNSSYSRSDLFVYDCPAKATLSTLKRSANKRSYSNFAIQQPIEGSGACPSKRARTTPRRCKRDFSDLIKYDDQNEEVTEVEEEPTAVASPTKRARTTPGRCKRSLSELIKYDNQSENRVEEEPTVVSPTKRFRIAPTCYKRKLNNIHEYKQNEKEEEEKNVKSTRYNLKKLSLTQSQDSMDWVYDSSMDWCYDSDLDLSMDWCYDSDLDLSMDWCYDSSMDWCFDLEYQQ